jgi:hypothetical protein
VASMLQSSEQLSRHLLDGEKRNVAYLIVLKATLFSLAIP